MPTPAADAVQRRRLRAEAMASPVSSAARSHERSGERAATRATRWPSPASGLCRRRADWATGSGRARGHGVHKTRAVVGAAAASGRTPIATERTERRSPPAPASVLTSSREWARAGERSADGTAAPRAPTRRRLRARSARPFAARTSPARSAR